MAVHGVLLAALLLGLLPLASCSWGNAALLARLQSGETCQPWTVPAAQQCAYIRNHAAICYPEGGFQQYLALHYCFFGQTWGWLSLALLLAAALTAFAVLLTVSERFFCPALELISDHLKLPPVVAGATLLSFGNGAPDTFTQVAAVGQEGGAAVGMALSEPLGGGMFASNVVFGLVVLIASKQQAVIQRWAFLKDVAFYLASLVIIALLLADGKVTTVEAGSMLAMYVVYVCATFYTSRADEPLHADLALHEFPPVDGGIDAHDSSSEDLNFESDMDHPEYIDATTSIREFDLAAPPSLQDHSCKSSSPADSEPAILDASTQLQGSSGRAEQQPGSRTLQALLSWRHGRGSQGGLREPLLVAIDESPAQSADGHKLNGAGAPDSLSYEANSSGDTVRGSRSSRRQAAGGEPVDGPGRQRAAAAAPEGCEQQLQQQLVSQGQQTDPTQQQGGGATALDVTAATTTSGGRPQQLPSPVFARLAAPDLQALSAASPAGQAAAAPQNPSPSRGFAAHGRRSFTEGVRLSLPSGGSLRSSSISPAAAAAAAAAEYRLDLSLHEFSPRAASDSGLGFCYTCGGTSSPRILAPPYTLPTSRSAASCTGTAGERGLLVVLPPHSPHTPRRLTADSSSWLPSDAAAAAAAANDGLGSGPLSPHLHQLHQQHFAEQVELLEQQAAEHDALLAAHEEGQEDLKAGGMTTKQRLQYPFVQLLSCTMPRVGTGSGHRYNRWRACLLPLTVPLLWSLAAPGLLLGIGWRGLVFGCACAAVGSCIIWATYPASSVPRKTLKGVFAVLAFVQAIVWLNLSASALVQISVVVGVIFGLQPALLGATVLAWGNSVPDLINNMAMAKDGFPSMAVAACFASPLFTLLVGMGGALAYGTVLHAGPLTIPVDGPLMVMAGFSIANMVQHLIVVPLVHRFRMKPSLAVITFLFYACFNVVYVLATVGVIKVQGIPPAAT